MPELARDELMADRELVHEWGEANPTRYGGALLQPHAVAEGEPETEEPRLILYAVREAGDEPRLAALRRSLQHPDHLFVQDVRLSEAELSQLRDAVSDDMDSGWNGAISYVGTDIAENVVVIGIRPYEPEVATRIREHYGAVRVFESPDFYELGASDLPDDG